MTAKIQERLVQGKRFNPDNPDRGLSEIESVLMEAEGDHAAASYNRAFFRDQQAPWIGDRIRLRGDEQHLHGCGA